MKDMLLEEVQDYVEKERARRVVVSAIGLAVMFDLPEHERQEVLDLLQRNRRDDGSLIWSNQLFADIRRIIGWEGK